jgi:hypothetical protein
MLIGILIHKFNVSNLEFKLINKMNVKESNYQRSTSSPVIKSSSIFHKSLEKNLPANISLVNTIQKEKKMLSSQNISNFTLKLKSNEIKKSFQLDENTSNYNIIPKKTTIKFSNLNNNNNHNTINNSTSTVDVSSISSQIESLKFLMKREVKLNLYLEKQKELSLQSRQQIGISYKGYILTLFLSFCTTKKKDDLKVIEKRQKELRRILDIENLLEKFLLEEKIIEVMYTKDELDLLKK